MQIEKSNNEFLAANNLESSHVEIDDQSQSVGKSSINLQESQVSQIYNEVSEICTMENEQISVGKEISRYISSTSHFSVYPDIFNDSNSFANHLTIPLCTNVILENRGTSIYPTNNELPIIDQEKEFVNGHIFNQPKNSHIAEFNHSSCSTVSNEKEEYDNVKCEVIDCDDSRIENTETLHPPVMVMASSHILSFSS